MSSDVASKSGLAKVLVPVDGSVYTDRVVTQLLRELEAGGQMDIHLLNVQLPVDSGHARMFIKPEDVEAYHREEGLRALKSARERLDAAGAKYAWHVAVGRIAETIVSFAQERGFDRIVMGTHGRTGLTQLLLGSVANDVSRAARIPVQLVG